MTFDDLSPEEQTVLTGLVRLVVRIDGQFSPDEVKAVSTLAKELGGPGFWSTMVESQALSIVELTHRAESIQRPEVREWIYGILVGLAAVDGIDGSETEFLDWIAALWSIE